MTALSRQRRSLLGLAVLTLALTAAAQAAPPRVIPWLDQRPVKAVAHPPLWPPCRAASLSAHLFLQGATGSLVGGVDLRNTGRTACSLLGWPQASFTGTAARTTHWRVRDLAHSPEPPDVLADPPGSLRALAPGKSATVSLFWSNWCGPGSRPAGGPGTPPAGLRLRLPGGTSLVVPLARAPRCDDKQAPSTLSVGPITPAVRHLPPSSRLPLRVAIVGPRPVAIKPGLRAFRVHRGRLLRYRVALTNTGTHAFRFASTSCPIYIEQLLPSVAARTYVLNCRPAGPIEPRQTVLFEMLLPIPTGARLGTNSLTWELAPKTYQAPFAPAAVWVLR